MLRFPTKNKTNNIIGNITIIPKKINNEKNIKDVNPTFLPSYDLFNLFNIIWNFG
jgi:hypothetical protein